MALKNNPFYLLKVSCSAGRREIVSASDEMSFMLDSEVCSTAQNELINLGKRLAAEINWFIDADDGTIERIRTSVENDEPISTEGLSTLSKLNATLHNFSLSNEADSFELGYSILELNESYAVLDADEITNAINKKRNEAKLGTVQVQDVVAELGKKREEIRQLITEKLSTLDQDAYVELVTMLAEKCNSDDEYSDGVVLSDVIDQYEVRMQATLETSTEKIEKHIEKIKGIQSTLYISGEIDSLIREVKEWDVFAQPLQLKSQASGMPHEISERLGSQLRNLSLYLHNEKELTKEALMLVNAMKSVFAEMGVLSDMFENDSDKLNDLLKGKKESEEIVTELNALQKEAENIQTYPSQIKVTDFVNRIKKLDQRIKAIDLDAETRTKVRENLCLMARGTAIELHNTKHETSYALTIANALVDEFGDLSSLRSKLSEDVSTLNQQLLLSSLNRSTPSYTPSRSNTRSSSSNNKGCLVTVLIFVVILVIVGIINGNSKKPSSSSYNRTSSSSSTSKQTTTTTKPTAKPTAKTEKQYSSTSAIGDYVYVNITLIEPEHGIYSSEVGKPVKSTTMYHHFVCKCTTDTGKTVWVSFPASDYRSKIDSSIDTFVNSHTSGFNGERVRFSPAAKLHGKVVRSNSVMTGLETNIGQSSIIEYSSIDIPTQTVNKKTTISIKSIFPSYTITSGTSNTVTHVLCEYTDSLGKKNWIYMTVSEYKKYFDSSANPGSSSYANEKKFSTAKKVTVTTAYADDYISGASSTIGQKSMYIFSGVN